MPVLVLFPHSRCNCRCVMCDIWKANENMQELSSDDLAHHLVSFRRLGVKWVTFSGGEALMHSNLWKLAEMLKAEGIKITLLSTGLLLKRNAENIVRWCDEVIVSLDGSQPVHDTIRNIPHAYERLREGVSALRELRPDFSIGARCVLQRLNFRDLPNIVKAAHELGLSRVSFLSADVTSEAFNRFQPWEDERVSAIALSPNEVNEFKAIIEETIRDFERDFANHFIEESPDKLRRLGQYYGAINNRTVSFPETSCNAPWVSAVVEADGGVRPCFFHPVIGNIHEKPLLEVLNSPEAIQFRQNLDVKTNPVCQKCVCTLHIGIRKDILA
ncbi:MAG: radical SAM protein [Anaerolineales bacterium]|nr:radical SAM protein [Anaerolineales bacterium]